MTLSSANPEASAFLEAGVDAMVWRGLGERSRFEALLLAEHLQYLDSEQVEHEEMLFGVVQVRQDASESWRGGGGLEYLYQDQVLDMSATEAELEPSRIRGHTFSGRAQLKRGIGGGGVAVEGAGTRRLSGDWVGEEGERAPVVEWSWPIWERTEMGLSYQYSHDWYDEDPALSAEGEPIPGVGREAGRHEVVLTGRHYWGEDRNWRLTWKLGGRVNTDLASGYYDYVRPQVSLRLRYRWGGWELDGGLRANHYDYRIQWADEVGWEHRRRSEVYFDFLMERRLISWLRLFARYDYERTFANRELEEYDVSTVSGGLKFEF
ncbi:MAG: hypothetical protein KJ072_14590 [Verrucomicrobia bacterium]|nr:hypothetical protein [Verrucomicrobiota bacterium]